jgi:hypothetical protein
MADQQLSTRDLADRSSSSNSSRALEAEQPADHMADADPAGDREAGLESGQSDEPLMRDAAEDHLQTHAHTADMGGAPSLLPNDQRERFTTGWQEIQISFVDQPRQAVAQADALVADLMQRLAASFSNERERLEAQWDGGEDVSTEDLRVALTRYRSFFDRLLSA